MADRRQRRSTHPQMAMRYLLDACCKRGGFEALVIAGSDGLAVEFSGDPRLAQELAAIAPLSALHMPFTSMGVGTSSICVESLQGWGQELYVVASGGQESNRSLAATCARGIERILAAN